MTSMAAGLREGRGGEPGVRGGRGIFSLSLLKSRCFAKRDMRGSPTLDGEMFRSVGSAVEVRSRKVCVLCGWGHVWGVDVKCTNQNAEGCCWCAMHCADVVNWRIERYRS